MPRQPKQHHYIYKTTCLVTGKFYVGMHSTDNLDDGYLGSGKILRYSINKHGGENHRKEILEHCPSREVLKLREKEIVNDELLINPLNINLKYGGEGGGGFRDAEHQLKASKAAAKNLNKKFYSGSSLAKERSLKSSETQRLLMAQGILKAPSFKDRKHTEQTLAKMRESQKGKQVGEKNSQHGTCWVTKNSKSVRIRLQQLDEYLTNGYTRGRKIS